MFIFLAKAQRKPSGKTLRLCAFAGEVCLEVKPRLKLYHPARERALCAAEVADVINGRRKELKRRKIQIVKCIEEVCFDFQKRTLSKERRQTGSLTQTQVYGKVSWTTERVPTNAWWKS